MERDRKHDDGRGEKPSVTSDESSAATAQTGNVHRPKGPTTNEDVLQLLADILKKVQVNPLQPRSLSDEALKAIALYDANRKTLGG